MRKPATGFALFLIFFLPAIAFAQPTGHTIHIAINISGGSAAYLSLMKNDSSYSVASLKVPLVQKDTVYQKDIYLTSAPAMLVNSNKHTTYYVLFPGDSIEVSIKNDLFTVKAKGNESRTVELAFFEALNRSGNQLDMFYNKIMNEPFSNGDTYTQTFDMAIRTAYREQVSFLEAYIKTHSVSRRFEAYTRQVLYYQFIQNLLTPVYNMRYAGKPLPNGYIDSILAFKTAMNDTGLLENTFGREALNFYNMFLCREKTGGLTGDSLTEVLYQSALAHFDKPLAEYLTYNFLRRAARGQREWFLKQSESFPQVCHNAVFTSIIEKFRADFVRESQLDSTAFNLLDSEGRTITLGQLLTAAGDSLVYIDFWASWCIPCLREMPQSEKLRGALATKKIRFVYLSIDATKIDWLRGMNGQKHLNNTNSFLVVNGPHAALTKYLHVEAIPRYVMYKNNKLLVSNAPRPSDGDIKRTLEKWMTQ